MRFRRASSTVILGSVLLGLAAACTSEPADWWRSCEDVNQIRLEEQACDDDDPDHSGGRYVYHPTSTTIPAVGQRMPPGGTYAKPSGSIIVPAGKGGLGLHTGSSST